jgi:hypothetical protein
VVDLQEFDWRTLDLNEGHTYSWAGTVRLDDDMLSFQRTSEIVHLEGDVCDSLDKLRIRGIVPERCHWMPKALSRWSLTVILRWESAISPLKAPVVGIPMWLYLTVATTLAPLSAVDECALP